MIAERSGNSGVVRIENATTVIGPRSRAAPGGGPATTGRTVPALLRIFGGRPAPAPDPVQCQRTRRIEQRHWLGQQVDLRVPGQAGRPSRRTSAPCPSCCSRRPRCAGRVARELAARTLRDDSASAAESADRHVAFVAVVATAQRLAHRLVHGWRAVVSVGSAIGHHVGQTVVDQSPSFSSRFSVARTPPRSPTVAPS